MYQFDHVKYKEILNLPDLEINENEITIIMGQSGSGKTSLLRLLNKLTSPTEGRIFYKNKNLKELNSVELRREVSMLSQSPRAFPGTVKENLLKALELQDKAIPEDKVLLDWLKRLKLNISLDGDITRLSGGEGQRLSLIRILLTRPKVLLLDEPTSALDELSGDVLMDSLCAYQKESPFTLIIVTHSKELAKTYAQRIITLKDGKVEGDEANE